MYLSVLIPVNPNTNNRDVPNNGGNTGVKGPAFVPCQTREALDTCRVCWLHTRLGLKEPDVTLRSGHRRDSCALPSLVTRNLWRLVGRYNKTLEKTDLRKPHQLCCPPMYTKRLLDFPCSFSCPFGLVLLQGTVVNFGGEPGEIVSCFSIVVDAPATRDTGVGKDGSVSRADPSVETAAPLRRKVLIVQCLKPFILLFMFRHWLLGSCWMFCSMFFEQLSLVCTTLWCWPGQMPSSETKLRHRATVSSE